MWGFGGADRRLEAAFLFIERRPLEWRKREWRGVGERKAEPSAPFIYSSKPTYTIHLIYILNV